MVFKGGLIILTLLLMFACAGQNGRDKTKVPGKENMGHNASNQADIVFDTLSYDFGTIIEGEMVVCYFDYENKGNGELVISSVEAGCGCTSPDWNREPLKPGEKDQLKVVFNARGRSGSQLKSVTVVSNALTPRLSLTIKANVTNNK